MTRTWFLKYLLNEPTTKGLVGRLRLSPYLRLVCGFADEVPSESAFSRFFTRISACESLLMDTMPMLVNVLHEQLPGIGEETAIDGSDIEAFGNGKRPLENGQTRPPHGVRGRSNRVPAIKRRSKITTAIN